MVSEHFRKVICNKVSGPIFNFIQRKLNYIHFAVYFPEILGQLFQKRPQNALVKTSVMEYGKV